MLTSLFVPFLVTAILIELTPGPNMAWLALISASKGKRAGFAAVSGIALGLGCLGAASAFGLAELSRRSPFTFELLRYAGVGYLFWLAWKAWDDDEGVSPETARYSYPTAWFRQGLLLNIFNPKAAVFFVVVLPAYIKADEPVGAQTFVLSATYVIVATTVHAALVLLAGQAHNWIARGHRQRNIRRLFAVLLAAIAVWFLASTA
ncbi:MAG: LysE family translocator [Sphingorhabdus sp.]